MTLHATVNWTWKLSTELECFHADTSELVILGRGKILGLVSPCSLGLNKITLRFGANVQGRYILHAAWATPTDQGWSWGGQAPFGDCPVSHGGGPYLWAKGHCTQVNSLENTSHGTERSTVFGAFVLRCYSKLTQILMMEPFLFFFNLVIENDVWDFFLWKFKI